MNLTTIDSHYSTMKLSFMIIDIWIQYISTSNLAILSYPILNIPAAPCCGADGWPNPLPPNDGVAAGAGVALKPNGVPTGVLAVCPKLKPPVWGAVAAGCWKVSAYGIQFLSL